MELQKKQYDRVWAEIDMDAIMHNVRALRARVNKSCKMMAVVKTDAYGHGAIPISRMLDEYSFIYGFATATAEEALILRRAGIQKDILVLGYTFPCIYEELIRENISLTLFREDTPQELDDIAEKIGIKAKVHIKVDTGMSRIGIFPDAKGASYISEVLKKKNILTEGIFTHLATADEADVSLAAEQIRIFTDFVQKIETENKVKIPTHHCSNSAGIMALPEGNLDVVRMGIALYGMKPSEEMTNCSTDLIPALSLKSRIVYIKEVPDGTRVSYGGTYITTKNTRIATIPVGYGDGYPRALSNKGYVLICGQRAPIIGRICMDQFMADVTEIDAAREGDIVTLIGNDEGTSISIEEICKLYGGFHYELPCNLGKRIPRVFFYKGKMLYQKDYNDDLS